MPPIDAPLPSRPPRWSRPPRGSWCPRVDVVRSGGRIWPGICGSLRLGDPLGVAVAEREFPLGYILDPPWLAGSWPLLLKFWNMKFGLGYGCTCHYFSFLIEYFRVGINGEQTFITYFDFCPELEKVCGALFCKNQIWKKNSCTKCLVN